MQGEGRGQRWKRALNIVWTAAGDYAFRPDVLAFHRDGSPDVYLNSIIGFVQRHYDGKLLHDYACELGESVLRDTFTDLFWLGLEAAAYAREAPERPALRALRLDHAKRFLADDVDVSMQELMLRRPIAHALRAARCREALGEAPGLWNPWDRQLYAALDYGAELSTPEIIARTREVLRRFFVFRFRDVRRGLWHLSVGERWRAVLHKVLPQARRQDGGLAHVPQGGAQAGASRERQGTWGQAAAAGRLAELEEHFGAPLYGEPLRLAWERDLCTGIHRGRHLYFSRGRADGAQRQANLAHFREHAALYRQCRKELSAYLEECLLTQRQALPVRARQGIFLPGAAWRGAYLGDERLFALQEAEREADVSVSLLLDASASRQGQEPLLAAQAYVMAQSLADCRIPVQILSYCSWQGYTILCVWKGFAERDCGRVFGYAAQGWNRDGLAFRAAGQLLARVGGRRLLIVLTDAHPSDDRGISRGSVPFAWEYGGARAREDAAHEARALRRQGIRVTGLLHSAFPLPMAEAAAKAIFGRAYARVDRGDRLAAAVGRLVAQEIGEG